jgi:hypothetical protein
MRAVQRERERKECLRAVVQREREKRVFFFFPLAARTKIYSSFL